MESYAQRLAEEALHRYPGTQLYTLEAIEALLLPEVIRHYLHHRVTHPPRQLLHHLPSWYNLHHEQVREAHARLVKTLLGHVHLRGPAWEQLVQETYATVLHFLVTPVSTLLAGFRGPSVPLARLEQTLEAFSAYPYFLEALRLYRQEKGVETLSVEALATLLKRIDLRYTQELTPEAWIALLQPLFSLFGEEGIPTPLLRKFFGEKEQWEIQRRLLHAEQVLQQPFISPDALQRLLQQAPVAAPTTSVVPEGPMPLWMKFARKPPAPATPHPSSSLVELEQRVLGRSDPELRSRFIRDLFQHREASYQRVLEKLARAASWPEASQIIAQDVFLPYHVDIYSPTAVTFTDLVEAQFARR